MLVVMVHVHVKNSCIEAFKEASIENASHSLREPGITRFDVIQHNNDPSRFVLIEIYRNEEAPAAHKQTEHYAVWRDTVADMMEEERFSLKYTNVYPDAER